MKHNLEINLEPPDGHRLSGRFCVGNDKQSLEESIRRRKKWKLQI